MVLNLENDLTLDYIYRWRMFEYEHLSLVNQIFPRKTKYTLFSNTTDQSILTFHSASSGTVPLRIFLVMVLTCFSKR